MAAIPISAHRISVPTEDALTRAFDAERAILDDLHAALLRQREAVAVDDLEGINATVFAAHRLLGMYREARANRRRVVQLLCEREGVRVEELEAHLGDRLSPAARAALEAVRSSAQRLQDGVAVNRELLQAAMLAGDQLVKAISAAQGSAGYTAGPQAGGRLLHVQG